MDTDHDVSGFRFHQVVKVEDIHKFRQNDNAFAIIGFASDEGVRRNKGRQGASEAPDAVRQALAKLPYHLDSDIIDAGNVICEGSDLEKAQVELGEQVERILQSSATPVIIGGGHETLYGHYLGVRKFLGKDSKLGIINIDAHFDLRDDELPSSGTMFRQIMEKDEKAGYLCLGVQEFGNTKALFKTADELGCHYMLQQEVESGNFQKVQREIDAFSKDHDYIMLTLCTDSMMASAAPGVSAPTPLGLDPKTVKKIMTYTAAHEKTISFDISEVNPRVDENGKTVKLAAYLAAETMKSFRHTAQNYNEAEEIKW
ncbi:formimidoylglutamase [Virgibacillus ihumii]|uniref:formimidoylglutamase n=1 Tax=Virgibacillus ihumii TaxID=2686091 RepID=UPI001FE9CA2D|nr:formimidoylglutamase [Virgibacillus ihumii]